MYSADKCTEHARQRSSKKIELYILQSFCTRRGRDGAAEFEVRICTPIKSCDGKEHVKPARHQEGEEHAKNSSQECQKVGPGCQSPKMGKFPPQSTPPFVRLLFFSSFLGHFSPCSGPFFEGVGFWRLLRP